MHYVGAERRFDAKAFPRDMEDGGTRVVHASLTAADTWRVYRIRPSNPQLTGLGPVCEQDNSLQ